MEEKEVDEREEAQIDKIPYPLGVPPDHPDRLFSTRLFIVEMLLCSSSLPPSVAGGADNIIRFAAELTDLVMTGKLPQRLSPQKLKAVD